MELRKEMVEMLTAVFDLVLKFVKTTNISNVEAIAKACADRIKSAQLVGELNDEEIAFIKSGKTLEAIKSYRNRHNINLLTARDAVYAHPEYVEYRKKHLPWR